MGGGRVGREEGEELCHDVCLLLHQVGQAHGLHYGAASTGHSCRCQRSAGNPLTCKHVRDSQGVLLGAWRENLAVMAGVVRGPHDLEAIVQLGDKLRGDGAQVRHAKRVFLCGVVVAAVAHTCPV